MGSMHFSLQLTTEDIKEFLSMHGYEAFELDEYKFSRYTDEMIKCFWHDGQAYILTYSDYSILLKVISSNGEEEIFSPKKFTTDDWYCFLKSKFGEEFVKYYAEIFKANELIYETSRYISRIPFDEFVGLIKVVLLDNPKKSIKFSPDNDVEVIEVESFFLSERRFMIKSKTDDSICFFRFSDFSIISPRLDEDMFHKFMIQRFGKEYIEDYEQQLYKLFEQDALPNFISNCHARIEKQVSDFIRYWRHFEK